MTPKTISIPGITAIIFMIALLAIPPGSSILINGTFYYRSDEPQNDPMEMKVMPGDTIYQGRIYDLTYVSGLSKKYAWWSDWKIEDTNCFPDRVINTSYIDTNGKRNPKAVFIEADEFSVGNWWQWDGCFDRYEAKSGTYTQVPYLADNNLAFRVIRAPVRPVYEYTEIPTIPIVIPTIEVTVQQTPLKIPVQKDEGLPWYIWGVIAGGLFLIWRFW